MAITAAGEGSAPGRRPQPFLTVPHRSVFQAIDQRERQAVVIGALAGAIGGTGHELGAEGFVGDQVIAVVQIDASWAGRHWRRRLVPVNYKFWACYRRVPESSR
jgi:hypothetical protein